MKQARQIRILAALTAAAAACAVFLSLFPKTASAEDAAPSRKITDMSAAEVQAVVLHNQSGTIGLLNLPSGVAVEGGDSSIYSQEKLVSLIYRLAHLDSSGAVEQGADGLAAFGLETPAAQASLLTQDETVRLYLGRRCPVSQEYYLLREGDTEIHLVEEETARMLLQGVSDLRQLELFPALTGESVRALRRIVIENSRGRVVLDQLQTDTISSFFGMTAPVAAPLNWKDVDDLVLVPLRALSPERFVSSDIPLSQYGLDQPEQNVFHIVAHVARLCQGGGVGNGEGHLQHPRQGLGEEGFAAAGGAHQQDVALLQLHVLAVLKIDALIVIVDRYRQIFLGIFLTNNILIKKCIDFSGFRHFFHGDRATAGAGGMSCFFFLLHGCDHFCDSFHTIRAYHRSLFYGRRHKGSMGRMRTAAKATFIIGMFLSHRLV